MKLSTRIVDVPYHGDRSSEGRSAWRPRTHPQGKSRTARSHYVSLSTSPHLRTASVLSLDRNAGPVGNVCGSGSEFMRNEECIECSQKRWLIMRGSLRASLIWRHIQLSLSQALAEGHEGLLLCLCEMTEMACKDVDLHVGGRCDGHRRCASVEPGAWWTM